MMLKETLRTIVISQRKELENIDTGIARRIIKTIAVSVPHAIIISGVRRCGKSTLMKQMIKSRNNFYYFNFEDQRALEFEVSDFERLDEVFRSEYGDREAYFFDEIQNVTGWERFVRRMLDGGKKFVITGSNASLLSRELGTRLTGRHITYELYPFSYEEMLDFTSRKASAESFREYMKTGGFPEFLRHRKIEMLQELMNDILVRDIVARHGLRGMKPLKELAVYLISNAGKEFSYSKLAKYFGMGSTNTAISYISYFEDSYLIFTVPKFDYSYRRQSVSPKKAYSIDVGLSFANSASFSQDLGRALENMVFLHMRRKYKDIFYYKGRKECDFLAKDKGKIVEAVQACLELTEDNKDREISGLKEAMERLKLSNGTIVTLNQEDKIGNISVVPAWKWMVG